MRVAIVTNSLIHYRVPFFNRVGEKASVTVFYSHLRAESGNIGFTAIPVSCRKVGPFWLQYGLFGRNLSGFDVVVFMGDLRWIVSLIYFIKIRSKVKVVFWGSWFTGRIVPDFLRIQLARMAYSNIFYSRRHLEEHVKNGVPAQKCFVANNSIHVDLPTDCSQRMKRNKFIFVGSLERRKRLDLVILAIEALKGRGLHFELDIIGSGLCEAELRAMVGRSGLENQIRFLGRIEDSGSLIPLFSDSLAFISPGQAGLSVLQSMAFGVPFVTYRHAISGGEIDNIRNGMNGILLDAPSVDSIVNMALSHISGNIDLLRMGRYAFETYQNQANISVMSDGFLSAIQ